jgi:DNA-directed RNA polymerase subunit omega
MPETENDGKVTSAYRLVILAAKRSKELQRGAPTRVDSAARKTTTIAIQEVRGGKIDFEIIDRKEDEDEGEANG